MPNVHDEDYKAVKIKSNVISYCKQNFISYKKSLYVEA